MTTQVAINAAKISRPKITGIFPRDRLFSELNSHKEQTAIWISSPPGAGKTSLICNYLEQQSANVVWYQVDEDDADLSTFFYYLGQAVQKSTARKRGKIPLLTPEFSGSVTSFSRHFFRTMYSRFTKDFIFVFDNFQNVADESKLHQLIAIAMEELPENGSFIILSRTQPAADYSRLIANSQLFTIGWEQLKLTAEETAEIFELKGLPQENVPAIMEVTQGWIAGLTLLFEQEGNTLILDKKTTEFNPKLIFNYFVNEVFNRADGDTQRLLVRTALLPKMNVEMVIQLTGIKNSSAILESLVAKNFFTQRHGNKDIFYEYHPLFREFLLEKSTQLLGEIELNVARWNAAELLEKNNQIEAAMVLYKHLEDWDKMAAVIENTARNLINQGRNFILQEWLSDLPEKKLDSAPWLLYWLATATKNILPQASLPLYEKAFAQFKENKDIAGLYLSWSGIIESIRMDHGGNTKRLDPWFIELDSLRKNYPEYPSAFVEIEVAVSMFTALWWHQPQNKDFDYWKQTALSAASGLPEENMYKLRVNNTLLIHYIFLGELNKTAYLLNETESLVSDELMPIEQDMFREIAQMLLAWRRGNWQLAYKYIEKAVKIGEETGFTHEYNQIMSIGATVALTEGNLTLAKQFVDKQKVDDQGTNGCRYHYTKAWYELLNNQLEVAMIHSEQAVTIAEETGGMAFFTGLSYLQLAIMQFKFNQLEMSFESLEKGRLIVENCHSKSAMYAAKMTEAYFYFSTDQREKGLKPLKVGLTYAQEQQFIGVNCLAHQEVAQLCLVALEEKIEVNHVKTIINKMGLSPPENAIDVDSWPWLIKIFCLGHKFEIQKDGQPIQASRKAQKKPLSVIKALIAFGGYKVPEAKIIEALWPDSDGDTGHQSLATTLHRLRKLLGNNVVALKEGYLSLNKKNIWIDAWEFEHRTNGNDENNDLEKVKKALDLYKGQFLEEDRDSYWSIKFRESLHHKFLALVESIGSTFEQKNNWQQASEYYLQGLEIDMMAEQLYQGLMRCYIEMDRAGDAVKTYRQCFRTLNSHLGVEPSAQTKKLFSQLQL